ncbi:MAG: hypothetical protein RL757_1888, partial [Bacteroidota bacterium]
PLNINVLANDTLNLGTATRLDSFVIVTRPTRGTATIDTINGRIVYRPDSCGRDSLIYKICNRFGCDTAIVRINVSCDTARALPPVAVFDTILGGRRMTLNIDVLGNDTLNLGTATRLDSFVIVTPPRGGTASIDTVTRRIVYRPDSLFCGRDSLIYKICNRVGCDTAIVRINVSCSSMIPLDSLPVAITDTAIVQKNTPRNIEILLNDTTRGARTPELISAAIHGLATISIDGKLIYVPDNNYCGKDSVFYRICNNFGCDTAVVRLTIKCSDSLIVWSGFSPNGDAKNEWLQIDGIENYPQAEVAVFNRWGERVFVTFEYQNNITNGFIGKWNGNSKDLPDGTYFCCIRDPQKGFLYTGYIQIHR